MPRLTQAVPKYRKHRASGQAIVSIAGRDHYLGPYGTRASKAEYDRLIGEWLANDRQPVLTAPERAGIHVAELITRYWKFCQGHYRRGGEHTRSLDEIKVALGVVRKLYGHTLIAEFGPRSLKTIQRHLVDSGLCRNEVNKRVGFVKRMFKWGAAEELVPPSIYQALSAVFGLQKGRTKAPDHAPVAPVEDVVVDATIPFLPPVVDDMVRLQRLTGARPAEVCLLRPCDLDRSGAVWEYRPEHHKTEHHDRGRVVLIGPKAQDVLLPYLLRPATSYCFSPRESHQKRKDLLRAARKSRVQPSQVDRSRPGASRIGKYYDTHAYRRAIHRAVDLANRQRTKEAAETGDKPDLLPKWSPNRIRHSVATDIRKRFGLEAAQVILGHSKADVTQVYAERDIDLARRVIGEVG